jgi:hypothetical protein
MLGGVREYGAEYVASRTPVTRDIQKTRLFRRAYGRIPQIRVLPDPFSQQSQAGGKVKKYEYRPY